MMVPNAGATAEPVAPVAVRDDRAIAVESDRYNATLVRREDQTPTLARFWVRPDEPAAFTPGQYLSLGLVADGALIQRPYSAATPRGDAPGGIEFYVRLVPTMRFTSLLWRATPGQRVRLGPPRGLFTLLPDDERLHLMVSTGTGVAPFVSMLRALEDQGRSRPTVIVHGVSHVRELGYRGVFERWQSFERSLGLTYVPTVSRPADPSNAGWAGRTGRVESVIDDICDELGIRAGETVAYLCGNPDMIESVRTALTARGLPEADVRRELYWQPQATAVA